MSTMLPAHTRNPETSHHGPVQVFQAEAVNVQAAARPRPIGRPREAVPLADANATAVQTFADNAILCDAEARPRPPGRERPTVEQLASLRPEVPMQMQVASDGTWLNIEAGRQEAEGLCVTLETDATWIRVEARAVRKVG